MSRTSWYVALAQSAILACLVWLQPGTGRAQSLSPAEARSIAKDATIYGFPLVDSYRIQYSYFVDRTNPEFKAGWNVLVNNARVYTPADKAIQTPNSDTPYSYVGADLRSEPLVLTVPAVDKGRYYSLQFIDSYTFNFAYVGSRATGSDAGSFLLAGPGWTGETPPGIKAVIRSETEFAFVLYRTQLFDPADIDAVKSVQAGYKVEPLSRFLGNPSPAAPPSVDFIKPLGAEAEKTSAEFFEILDFVLQFCPPNPAEADLLARFAKLGLGGHGAFKASSLSPEMRAAVEAGMQDAWASFGTYKAAELDTGRRTSADAFGTRQFLNGDTMARFSGSVLGIYGNSKAEALYPVYFVDDGGKALTGADRYTLRFGPDQLPPVNAFWSLTMYELPSSLLSANPLNRYLINSPMLPSLRRDADGGITLYLQHDAPGTGREANWLPAPEGRFFAVMRLYWPKEEALDGRWKAPPLLAAAAKSADTGKPALTLPVTPENFPRAESDLYFTNVVKDGGFGRLVHRREPASVDNQTVIRLNRDTLYSAVVLDLDAGPATISLPDAGGRFMSMQVIDEDQYTPGVYYGAGAHTLRKGEIGTRYVLVGIRTLVDPNDPQDVAAVHALQDAMTIDQPGGPGTFQVPQWDPESQTAVRNALLVLAATLPDTRRMFGPKDRVDPVRRLIGSASAWGGNPESDALYLNVVPQKNDGRTVYALNVKEVPVDGFWSISLYNAKGFYEANGLNAYSINNITAKKGADGSITVQFGGCDGKISNCLPTMDGWTYMVRLYRPRSDILDGTWMFPEAKAVK